MRPWFDESDPLIRQRIKRLHELMNQYQSVEIAKFDNELPQSEVIVMEDAAHRTFMSHEDEVLQAIEDFIEKLE